MREDEQAEHDEQPDLRCERQSLVEGDELAAVARRRAADRQADEVDGEETAAADRVGRAERHRGRGDRRNRGERPDRLRDAREQPGRRGAERDADEEPEPELPHDLEQQVGCAVAAGTLDPRDQPDRERDRHRVVAARLGFERARETASDLREAQRREDGGGVRRGDDGAEQERLEPRDVEQRPRREARDRRGGDDADRAQERRGNRDLAQPAPRCLQAALVEDEREADDADPPRELRVVERDPARPVRPEQHAEPEERHQDGQSRARGAVRRHHARAQHGAGEQHQEALVHASILSAFAPAGRGHTRCMPRASRYLGIYLNDHLAGSTAGVELIKRAAREHASAELGVFLRTLASELEEDREALRTLMRELGVREQRAKVALGWTAEKLGRLKLNGHVLSRSPLTPLVELEGLALGVFGKRQMWLALAELPLGDDVRGRCRQLAERAQHQLDRLEEHRLRAAGAID